MINKLTIKNSVKIINDEYVIKKKKQGIDDIYNYLISRSFNYFPNILKKDSEYIYYEYIKDIQEPLEQKIADLVSLVSLLHNKTTFYKEVDIDYFKKIYEEINELIDNSFNYYNNLMDRIDEDVYMAPSKYLLAKNITNIFNSLNFSKFNIDRWYKKIFDEKKVRMVLNHNNLCLDHFIKNSTSYLISFDSAIIDIPIYDMIKLYKRHCLDFDFSPLFKLYFSKYPYTQGEMILFLSIISIPNLVSFSSYEYENVLNVRRLVDYVYRTSTLITEYDIENET